MGGGRADGRVEARSRSGRIEARARERVRAIGGVKFEATVRVGVGVPYDVPMSMIVEPDLTAMGGAMEPTV